MQRTSISIDHDLAIEWQKIAEDLGYGERGRLKFLRVMLVIAKETPSLFNRR